ncbi:MAG: diadenylate cyclase [Crocinitomicaceae bacterium TMED114]|nr:MAG: diadenylate cyclase [Crocinitomicaceae bacterium TMED114]RPG81545.1 MAG: diadenylate cyclase [Crocinitomicaceae bacterium TMED114]
MIEQPALPLGVWQLLDILAVAFILYQLYRLTRGTAAIRIFLGVLAIYLVYQIVDALQMRMLAEILGQFIGVGVIALLIVFQQELRQFLLLIGNRQWVQHAPRWLQKWMGRDAQGTPTEAAWSELQSGLEECRRRKLGALVVIPKDADPGTVATGWKQVDAVTSAALVVALFEKSSPLHDGAMCLDAQRIRWAGGILPVSGRLDLPAQCGTRHRAAVGISEQTDAVVVVISEETGGLSIAHEGRLETGQSLQRLPVLIESALRTVPTPAEAAAESD